MNPKVKAFLSHLADERGLSPNTVRNYRQVLGEFQVGMPSEWNAGGKGRITLRRDFACHGLDVHCRVF
ncbi:hypothetical protein EBY67_03970 [bacterium]|nr:hypothetical protein [bacterium]